MPNKIFGMTIIFCNFLAKLGAEKRVRQHTRCAMFVVSRKLDLSLTSVLLSLSLSISFLVTATPWCRNKRYEKDSVAPNPPFSPVSKTRQSGQVVPWTGWSLQVLTRTSKMFWPMKGLMPYIHLRYWFLVRVVWFLQYWPDMSVPKFLFSIKMMTLPI